MTRSQSAAAPPPSSREAIAARARTGAVLWRWLIVISFARFVLALAGQGLSALVLSWRGSSRPFVDAADWFTVHGSLVDLGTLALLVVALRREGLTVVDLFRARDRPPALLRSLALVPLLLVTLVGAGFAGAALTGLVVYGSPLVPPPVVHLPLWAGLYSALVWPLLWGFVEEATYNGYAAPRAEVLGKGALAIVCLGWAVQHLALPLRFDAAFLAVRFFPALAVAVVAVAIYLRTRDLIPLVISHWLVDAATGAMTLMPPGAAS